jgi:hypothetical protein
MNEIEAARQDVKLYGEIARTHWGKPNYPFLKREWLDAVDRLNRLTAAKQARIEAEREAREDRKR